jgi:hypothetical protein
MSAVLPHLKAGPANMQVASLVFGGQVVMPNTASPAGTTDFTVKPAVATSAAGCTQFFGVAGKDANVMGIQTASPNSYGEPQIDISILDDYTSVYYGGVDIWVWYGGPALPGELITVGTVSGGTINGCVAGISEAYEASTAITPSQSNIVGRCTMPGGVPAGALVQQIGGIGAAAYYLARARIF